MPDIPEWLLDDAAAYDALRNAAAGEAAALIAHGAVAEARDMLSAAYTVDAFRRTDVDAAARKFAGRHSQAGADNG